MEVRGEELLLRVDDAGARYPIVVDPFVQQAKLTASGGAEDDEFGFSVAISGDTVVVGAPGKNSFQGAAYVFVKPSGGWTTTSTFTAKLTASDGTVSDEFGWSVAVSGDTVLVGAALAAGANNADQGAAYVFVKPSGGWSGNLTETTKLTASDGATFDNFGFSVAVSGDTVVVGAPGKNSLQGAAYVFVKPSGSWSNMTETAKLTASDGAAFDEFGLSVAVSGDTVVVDAPFADGANTDQGAAYVFVKPSGGWSGNLTENAKLTASDGALFDEFGLSVAVSGDTVVVGAPFADGANTDQGAAYVFVKPSGGWTTTSTFTAKLTASDGAPGDVFGFSVAVSGDTVVVGAPFDDIGSNTDQGSAYVFVKSSGGWTTTSTFTAKLTASDGALFDLFGYSVSVSGGTVVVGARFDDIGGNTDQGSAYVFGSSAPLAAPVPVASPAGLMAAVGALLALGLRRLRRSGETIRGF
jgi:uncharacterized protein (DUF2345 family)